MQIVSRDYCHGQTLDVRCKKDFISVNGLCKPIVWIQQTPGVDYSKIQMTFQYDEPLY